MGTFSENWSGNRCCDCSWADDMEEKVKRLQEMKDEKMVYVLVANNCTVGVYTDRKMAIGYSNSLPGSYLVETPLDATSHITTGLKSFAVEWEQESVSVEPNPLPFGNDWVDRDLPLKKVVFADEELSFDPSYRVKGFFWAKDAGEAFEKAQEALRRKEKEVTECEPFPI